MEGLEAEDTSSQEMGDAKAVPSDDDSGKASEHASKGREALSNRDFPAAIAAFSDAIKAGQKKKSTLAGPLPEGARGHRTLMGCAVRSRRSSGAYPVGASRSTPSRGSALPRYADVRSL